MADNQETQQQEQQEQKGEQQQQQPDTRAWVPEKLKGHKSLEKFKTAEDALNAHLNLESAFGKKFEEHLKDDAAPEIKARVNAALGIPESADAYEFAEGPKDDKGNPTLKLDEAVAKSFKEVAHKARLSKAQVKALSEWQINLEIARNQSGANERAEAEQKGMDVLKQKWGAAADRNIALCQQVVAEVGGKDLAGYLNESGMTNDPRVVEFLARIGSRLAEDKLITPNPIGLSADDAKLELAKIRKDSKTNGYLDKNHPDHKRIVARVAELTQLANPDIS